MADWLARAKREFAQSAGPVTANTAEKNPTAVTAAPDAGDAEILRVSIGSNGSATATDLQEIEAIDDDDRRACTQCANPVEGQTAAMTAAEEVAIRTWLSRIGETDREAVSEVLAKSRHDGAARTFFAVMAAGEPP